MSDPEFKAGFAVILGRPSAGKSTLLNALLKSKLSIVSPKPQTTRHRILGILDGPGYQLCLVDTPGLIREPKDPLQNSLRRQAMGAAHEDPDVMVLLVEPHPPDEATLREFSHLARQGKPIILVLNKIDLPAQPGLHDEVIRAYSEILKPAAALRLCALKGEGVNALLAEILKHIPLSPPFYEPGQYTDRFERFFAAEIIREQVFNLYEEEIPHATAVVIERFQEVAGSEDQISAILYVERDSQKGIIIGARGRALRELQERSLQAITDFLGRPAYLDIWIKVRKNWRKDPRALKEFGYLT
ncbi:MAG TPA: GTPase Era [Elusimicrobia bacterium]|nr:GTPase Era [Elusimicrobiota bacterium]HBT62597.1 GTPase Era [Elusimicrobiota bacterium]